MLNAAVLNTRPLNAGTQPEALPALTSDRGVFYRLELRDRDGVCLANIDHWHGAQRTDGINEIGTLQFTVSGSDLEYLDELAYPNEVWLYRGDYDEPWACYTIWAVTPGYATGAWTQVECKSYQAQLAREPITSYSAAGKAVQTVLEELLASHQTIAPAIGIGKIAPVIGETVVTVEWENRSILEATNDLQERVGGQFWVDTKRRLWWARTRYRDQGHWIRQGHNLLDIRRRRDWWPLTTQIQAMGEGLSRDTALTSTQDNADAQSEYGVLRGIAYHRGVATQGELDAIAQAQLSRVSAPRTTYPIRVVDLSALASDSYSFEASLVNPGMPVKLVSEEPAVDIQSVILSCRWNLDRPQDVEVSLTNPDAGGAVPSGGYGGGTYAQDGVGGNDPAGSRPRDMLEEVVRTIERVRTIENGAGSVVRTVIERIVPGGTDPENIVWQEPAEEDEATGETEPGEGNLAERVEELLRSKLSDPVVLALSGAVALAAARIARLEEDTEQGDADELRRGMAHGVRLGIDAQNQEGAALTDSIADQLMGNATPPPIGAVGDTGTSDLYAREDHTHAGPQPGSAPPGIATGGSAGSGTAYARANHTHAGVPVTGGTVEFKVESGQYWARSNGGTWRPMELFV